MCRTHCRLSGTFNGVSAIRVRIATAIRVATLIVCATPSLAAAAGEPKITSAGIDADDRVVVTWTLASGTTFDSLEIASSPILDEDLPEAFADDNNTAGSHCWDDTCGGSRTQTSYRQSSPVARDRRYFVIVTAKVPDR